MEYECLKIECFQFIMVDKSPQITMVYKINVMLCNISLDFYWSSGWTLKLVLGNHSVEITVHS